MGKDYSNKKTTIEDAKKWYKSFIGALQFEGIDIINPFSLGLVRIKNDVPEIGEESLEDPKSMKNFIASTNNIKNFAFMKLDKKGNYQNPMTENEDPANWIYDNMQRVDSLSDKDILRLYEAAKNDKLFIQSPEMEDENLQTDKIVYVDENGLCRVSDTLVVDVKQSVNTLVEAGFKRDNAEKILDERIAGYNEYHKDIPSFMQSAAFDFIAKRGHKYPEWFNTPEKRAKITPIVNAHITPTRDRTEEQIETCLNTTQYSVVGDYFLDSLVKKFNPEKDPFGRRIITMPLKEIFDSGKITDRDGNPINSGNYYKDCKETIKLLRENKAVYVDEKPYFPFNDFGLVPAVNVDTYRAMLTGYKANFKAACDAAAGTSLDYQKVLKACDEALETLSDYEPDSDEAVYNVKNTLRKVHAETEALLSESKSVKNLSGKEKDMLGIAQGFNKIMSCIDRNIYAPMPDDLTKKSPESFRMVIADPGAYSPKASSQRKQLFESSYGGSQGGKGLSDTGLNLALPSDCRRICKYDPVTKKMTYPLFDEKSSSGFLTYPQDHYDFLDTKNITEILNSGDYIYFKADPKGPSIPYRIVEGKAVPFGEEAAKDEKFAELIKDPDFSRALDAEKAQRSKDFRTNEALMEDRRRQLFFYNEKIAQRIFDDLCGTKVGPEGDEEYRSFSEDISHALKAKGDYDYPSAAGLKDDDVVALTILSFADPDVNGDKYLASTKEASALGVFDMWPTDFYIQRSGKTGEMLSHLQDTRKHTKEIITKYNENKDITILASHFAKTVFTASVSGCFQAGLSNTSYGALMPAHYIAGFMNRHPEVVKAAYESLKNDEEALKKFEQGIKNIKSQENTYNIVNKSINCKDNIQRNNYCKMRDLLNYEGELYCGKYNGLTTDAEREYMEKQNAEMSEAMKNGKDINAILTKSAPDIGLLKRSFSDTPMRVMLQDNDAEKLLSYAVEELDYLLGKNEDPEILYRMIENSGAFPVRPEYALDSRGVPKAIDENHKMYTKHFEDVSKMSPKECVKAAKSNLETEVKKIKAIKMLTFSFFDDNNIDFEDLITMAAGRGVSAAEYACNSLEEIMNAEWSTLEATEKLDMLEKAIACREIVPNKDSLEKISEKLIECADLLNDENANPRLSKMVSDLTKICSKDKNLAGVLKEPNKLSEIFNRVQQPKAPKKEEPQKIKETHVLGS